MFLLALLAAPFAAALITAFASGRDSAATTRLATFLAVIVAALGLPLVTSMDNIAWSMPWFNLPGTSATISFSLASDGLSGWLIQLVTWLTPLAILASRDQVGERMREFSCAIFTCAGLMIGALLARDLVVFYLFFEGMLVPMLVLIAVFGGADRRGAALQFFLYTMAGSILLLVAIWYLAQRLGTTSLADLPGEMQLLNSAEQLAVFFAFALAFAVKVPLVPFHTWQARTYSECPTGAVMLLAGAMAKIGTYGLLRFVLPLFPAQCVEYASVFITLGLIGTIGGALLAMMASDVKKLIAFSSLSHLSLVVVGIFVGTETALRGASVQMVAHGFSVAAMFLLIGAVESRAQRRGLDDFGGLSTRMPLFAACFVVAALASAALPGTAGFAGEFLLLFGIFLGAQWWISAIAGLSTILTAVYLLRLVQRWCYGRPNATAGVLPDLAPRELLAVVPLLLMSIYFGFHPRPISDRAGAVAIELGSAAAELRPQPPQQAAAVTAPATSPTAPSGAPHASR